MRIGIDVGGTKIEAIALDEDGTVLRRQRVATPRGNYEATLDAVARLVQEVESDLRRTGTIGIGLPGAISSRTGLLKNSNSTVLNGHAVHEDLARKLGRAIRTENDANCFALSEAIDGAGAGHDIVFGVILGTGVGGGLVVDRRCVVGRNRIAGEWGHNPLPWVRDEERPGPPCYCGRTGCIETFLSGDGLRRAYLAQTGSSRAGEEIAAAAQAGDEPAQECLRTYQDRLARSLAAIINVLDPDVVVLGGGLSNIDALYDGLGTHVGQYAFSDHLDTQFVRAVHGDSSGVRGAAWLWPHR